MFFTQKIVCGSFVIDPALTNVITIYSVPVQTVTQGVVGSSSTESR
jgi:hypothetical protein